MRRREEETLRDGIQSITEKEEEEDDAAAAQLSEGQAAEVTA